TLARLQPLHPAVEWLPAAPAVADPPAPAPRRNGRAKPAAPPPAGPPPLPAGLAHLERELLRPLRQVKRSADADGLLLTEARGVVGEVRMVARQIRLLLGQGVRPDDVLVTVRDLPPYADLVAEVFGEYGIPLDIEGAEPLLHNPAVAALLRTL